MYNTPPTFGIYIMGLVFKWLKNQGGLTAMQKCNEDKAGKLYRFLDESQLFKATADADSRSLMNVTFITGDDDLDAKFLSAAKEAGLDALKGHRSIGGMRASLYNAFPPEGVDRLVEVLRDFEAKHF
jgi:phosphoserine aminotransferase